MATLSMTTSRKGRAWAIVILLAAIQGLNQVDKLVVGFAAGPIMQELQLTPAEYGLVAGSLFATFSLGGLAVAFFAAPRFVPRVILVAMLAIWSLAQLPVILAASMATLIASRLALGAGEGGATPTCLNMSHEWFPDRERGFPDAIIIFGGTIGALIAAPMLTFVIATFGWRSGFVVCALLGLVMLLLWVAVARDGPFSMKHNLAEAPGHAANTTGRPMQQVSYFTWPIIQCQIVGFCAYFVVGFGVGWLPAFVESQQGLPDGMSGWVLSLIYLGQGLLVLAVASVSHWLFARGHGPARARQGVILGCMAGSAMFFIAVSLVDGLWVRILMMTFATGLIVGVFPMLSGLLGSLAGTGSNRLMTIVLSLMTVAGLVAPPLVGLFITPERSDGWSGGLVLVAAVAAAGALAIAIGRRRMA